MVGFTLTTQGKETVVKSPNGQLVVTIDDERGLVNYSVTYQGKTFLKPSALGLKSDIGDFTQGLTLKDVKQSKIDQHYQMTRTKASSAHYVAQQADLTYTNRQGLPITITFCVSDNDIAFRYSLQPKGDSRLSTVIYNETTSFNFPEATTTFLTPQSLPMVGWQRTKPSYEEDYKADMPMTERSAFGEGFTFPCLFKVPNGWVLVSETGVGSNYCGSHLSDYAASSGYTIAFPNIGEMNGLGSSWAGLSLPGSTPWRTITLGTTLKPIVETTIPYDVVEPLYEPSQAYQPGRYPWSWLIWQDESVNYDDQVKMIDLSAAMGYEYVLVDNWWDKQIGRDRIVELNRYANSKGVKLLLWYNSNGYANDAPQTPRNCMNTALARNREMAWLQKLGIAGIKVDFLGSDKQENLKLYEDILADANRYGLQVVFHGCTIPRGWERMYPNYVGSEAVLASENIYFSQGAADKEAKDAATHPFIRNAIGCMEFGGCFMNRHIRKGNRGGNTRKTSDCHELATCVLFQNPIQNFAITPENLPTEATKDMAPNEPGAPAPAISMDFLREVPTTWDETVFIDGYPGKYCVLARRNGDTWYIAGNNATGAPLTLKLNLPMLAKGDQATLYSDNLKDREPQKATLKVSNPKSVTVTMVDQGGFVIVK